MGVVYKAKDQKLDRTVALKFLPSNIPVSEVDKQRFIREAKTAAALNHPHICTVHSVDEYDGAQFIVMEYVDGVTLRQKSPMAIGVRGQRSESPATGNRKLTTVIDYSIQIAEALSAAHRKGIVHRDIKSNNIMVTESNEIKILDFGLAKIGKTQQVTQEGRTVGTVTYMSPEQVRGEEIDARSDIWSLGVVLYETITGTLPFGGDYEHAVMYSIVNEEPPPVSEIAGGVTPELEQIVNKCLAKDPSDRYQSASDLLQDLKTLRGGFSTAKGVTADRNANGMLRGLMDKKRLYFTSAAIASGALLFLFLILYNWGTVQNWFTGTPHSESIRLMVLPFDNIGDDPERQVFCDGLVETITSNLSQIEQFHRELSIVPAGEARSRSITTPGEAHQIFGVNYAVTGSLQPIADRLRLTINLVDPEEMRVVNSERIDVAATDVLALHDKSVENMMNMLNLELKPESREIMKAGYSPVQPSFEMYLQGIGHLQRYENIENIRAAIDAFEKSIELDPQFALAYAGLGQAYWRKYDFTREPVWIDKAKEHSRTAQDINDKLAQVNITLGMINTGTGQYQAAIENFNDVLAADPTNADAYRELARVHESLGEVAEAESTLKRSIQLKPGYWAGYNVLGAFYLRQAQYNRAIEQFEKVIDLTPDNYIGYMNLGNTYYFLNRLDEARSMYERSLELQKTYDAASNLATLNFIEGRYGEAARAYETALDINNRDYQVWGNLASAYYWTPDMREKAFPAYERAVELAEEQRQINPNDPDIVISLAGYTATIGDEDEARIYIQEALDMAPDNTTIMFHAGTTYERLGEREKALHWIGRAIEHGYSEAEIINQPELQELISDERFQERFGR